MPNRIPQRTYTPHSLEAWFHRLNGDWERLFNDEELRWGRRFYRTAEVRSTELLDRSAIVHFRQGKEPLYVIVDWEGGAPSFRLSHPEFAPGRGLGVAVLYELEELVADELPPVPRETDAPAGAPAAAESAAFAVPEDSGRAGRLLRVRLVARQDGLHVEAGWEGDPAASAAARFTMRELTRWEREQLIGFTARAHRCGFRPVGGEGTYRLADPDRIAHFLGVETDDWRRRYQVEEDPALAAWRRGPRLLRPVITVRGAGLLGSFRFDFGADGWLAPEGLRQQLFRLPGHTHFHPGEGIFQVDPAALGSVHEWKALLPAQGKGILPRYLLLAFARDPQVELRLADEMQQWRRDLETGPVAIPPGLPACLRPYQREGVGWLMRLEAAGCHSLLADEMGLGKTLQVLSFLAARGALAGRLVLVVCPASVLPVWQAEIARHFPATRVRVLSRTEPFDASVPALWLSSYTQLRRHKHLLEEIEFDHAILDEAQNIKNPEAKVTHACLAIRSRHRLALTGTPLENRPLDLWTLFRFLMPGLLGTRRQFEELLRAQNGSVAYLRAQIAPFVLRRTKQTVAADLPEKLELDCVCELTPVQRRCYEELAEHAAGDLAASLGELLRERRLHVFSLLTRLRQACCDPALLPGRSDPWHHSGKLQVLCSRLGEAFASGSKVVVFSQFVQFLRRARACVQEQFRAVPQFELTGATLDRERPVRGFSESAGPAVFFVSLRAGGTGLNLQAADYVFLLDPWWNPAVEAQAVDRVHRLGQRQRVIVYRMVARGTIEDRIDRLKQEKSRLFEGVLSDLDAPADLLQQFGSLQELIALDAPAE